MAGEEPEPDYRAVTGVALRIPPDRTDTLFLQLMTRHGPFRFALSHDMAMDAAMRIVANAQVLKARQQRR
jgi:hypothetical protein